MLPRPASLDRGCEVCTPPPNFFLNDVDLEPELRYRQGRANGWNLEKGWREDEHTCVGDDGVACKVDSKAVHKEENTDATHLRLAQFHECRHAIVFFCKSEEEGIQSILQL
jgi:hypothetical protein